MVGAMVGDGVGHAWWWWCMGVTNHHDGIEGISMPLSPVGSGIMMVYNTHPPHWPLVVIYGQEVPTSQMNLDRTLTIQTTMPTTQRTVPMEFAEKYQEL